MPVKAKHPCSRPGCPNLQPCPIHIRKAWAREKEPQRLRGRALQRERELLLRANPLCAECLRHGIYSRATQRDHIIPLAEGGADIRANTQGLCVDCHEKKRKEEAKRGRELG